MIKYDLHMNGNTFTVTRREPEAMSTSPLQFALDTLNGQLAGANNGLALADSALKQAQAAKDNAKAKVEEIQAAIDSIQKLIPTKVAVERFFTASRSYGGPGHYSEKFADGTWGCTCKGFKFNAYCWATDQLKASQTARDRNRFVFGAQTFNARRDAAAQKAFAK